MYAAKETPESVDATAQLLAACSVIAHCPEIADWLTANDPMALRQVRRAITKAEKEGK